MTTNEILWKIYQNQNCSQTEFCKKIGYKTHTSNMSQWLNGRLFISYEKLEKICEAFNYKLIINYEKL
jgi:transcriptional regulator with XRE-family HTH domain